MRKSRNPKNAFSVDQGNLGQINIDKILNQNAIDWKTRLKVIEYDQQRSEVSNLEGWREKKA